MTLFFNKVKILVYLNEKLYYISPGTTFAVFHKLTNHEPDIVLIIDQQIIFVKQYLCHEKIWLLIFNNDVKQLGYQWIPFLLHF